MNTYVWFWGHFFENHVRKDYWNNHTQIINRHNCTCGIVLQDFVTAESWTVLLRHIKGRYRQIYLLDFFTADGFPFAKISNLAIISNAYADCCSEIWFCSFYAFRVYFPFLIITKSFAISLWRSCFDFLWLIPRSSEISFEVTVMLSVMYEITASCLSVSISGRFCKIWVLVDLLSGTNARYVNRTWFGIKNKW